MEWNCSECTYRNSSSDAICVVCIQGYRLFSTDDEQNNLCSRDDGSDLEQPEIPVTFSSANHSNEHDSLLTWTDQESSNVPESSVNSSDEVEGSEEDSLLSKINNSNFIIMKPLH